MKFILITLFALMLNFAVQAQEKTGAKLSGEQTKEETKKSVEPTAKDYADLVAKLKGGDTNVDYMKLRMAFTKTDEYSFHGPDKTEREKFLKPFGDKKYKDALKQVEKYLEKNYVDANAHYVAYNSAKELKDDAKAEFYKSVLLGLLNSIKNGNDGLSAETPFFVISIDEEYTLMKFLGFQHSSQSLQHKDGHTFDVFEIKDTKTSKDGKIYFNIDVVWAAETNLFK